MAARQSVTMDPDQSGVLLLIPCYNEQDNIAGIIQHLAGVKQRMDERQDARLDILVINDGSTDRTREVLEHSCSEYLDCWTIHLPSNQGYGHVLRTGFKLASDEGYDWVITFDMDGQHEPTCLYKFIDAIVKGTTASMISGSRYLDPDLFWQNPWKDRFLVNTIVTGVFNAVMPASLTDAFCGMKAHDVASINAIDLTRDGYEMPVEMLYKTVDAGQAIIEVAVPVIYKNRDEVIKKSSPDSLLFKKGEERIEKYLTLLAGLRGGWFNAPLDAYTAIFERYFNETGLVTRDSFKTMQRQIFDEIASLERA